MPYFRKKLKFSIPYLTSADDGPHPRYTQQLLDGLKERGVHATFFVTGDCVMILPDWQNPVNKGGSLI